MRASLRVRVGRDLGLCLALLLVNLQPSAVQAQGVPHEFREVHLGMEMRIVIVHAADSAAVAMTRRAFAQVEELEMVLSDWRAESEVRRLERAPAGAWIPISQPLRDVLAIALRVAHASGGALDPTIGPLTALWRESARSGRPIGTVERAEALARVGYRHVELDSAHSRVRFARARVRLDLGAVAKGWILDETLRALLEAGATAALVEAGGDVVVHGAPPGARGWRILVPRVRGDTTLELTGGAVSTSGSSVQWIEVAEGATESHLIDPRSGRGANGARDLTVVGPHGAITDALATALALSAPERRDALAKAFGVVVIAAPTP